MVALKSAKEQLRSLQVAYAAKANETQRMHSWVHDNASLFLDLNEESQVVVDAPWESHQEDYSSVDDLGSLKSGLKRRVEVIGGESAEESRAHKASGECP